MNPISNTAFYCCGVRMQDAARKHPICNDRFAKRFMNAKGMEIFAPFESEHMPNIGNATRCRIIDDLVRGDIAGDGNTRVVNIGAGFDTRPYRIEGGRWIEIDEPEVIDHKNQRLPVGACPNPLRRIAIDFSKEALSGRLNGRDDTDPVVVVIEGVFMYLDEEATAGTLRQLQELFPEHTLICDLMNRRFYDRFVGSMQAKLAATGARFSPRPDDPVSAFVRSGYVEIDRLVMFKRAAELGALWELRRIPRWLSSLLLNVVLKDLNGYAVHRLEKKSSSPSTAANTQVSGT